jgi:hypothetical protein
MIVQINTLFETPTLSVMDYRCSAAPGDKPYVELFAAHSISYVRKGSFGYCSRGRKHELVPGSLLIGHGGDEYSCSHDHHGGGDECLSFQFTPEVVEAVGDDSKIWRLGCIPPLPKLMVLGELAQSAFRHHRCRFRCRVQRPFELRPYFPPRGGPFSRAVSAFNPWRAQDFPRSGLTGRLA